MKTAAAVMGTPASRTIRKSNLIIPHIVSYPLVGRRSDELSRNATPLVELECIPPKWVATGSFSNDSAEAG